MTGLGIDGRNALQDALLVRPYNLVTAYARFLQRFPGIRKGLEMSRAVLDAPVAGPPKSYRSIATGAYPNMTEEFIEKRRTALRNCHDRGRTPRIEVGSTDMRCIFGSGLKVYQPTLGGALLQPEGGTTQESMDNVREIAGELGLPLQVRVRSGEHVEFLFPGSETYVATGFGVGYSGVGPAGLAEVLVGFNDPNTDRSHDAVLQMRRFLRKLPRDFTGMIRRYIGRHDSQPTRKTWVVGATMNRHGSVL